MAARSRLFACIWAVRALEHRSPAVVFTGLRHMISLAHQISGETKWSRSSMTAWQPNRQIATGDLRVVHPEAIPENSFHKAADHTLDILQERLEAYVEDLDIENSDVEYGMGVLNIKLGKQGTYVINKQTPNRQIWLSSPVSGPYRFDLVGDRWIYNRTGQDLVRLLETEFAKLFDTPINLEA